MKTLLICICVLAIGCGCASTQHNTHSGRQVSDVRVTGLNFGYYISTATRDRILKAPIWRAGRDNPPLSPRKADQLATNYYPRIPAHLPGGMDRQYIALLDSGDGLHWVYVVQFTDLHGAYAGLPPHFDLIVLMDGTVVEPVAARFGDHRQSDSVGFDWDWCVEGASIFYPDQNSRYASEIPWGATRKTPLWKTGADYPPLSARKAAQLATRKFRELAPHDDSMRLACIILWPDPDGPDWCYVVEFIGPERPENIRPRCSIIVMMDGTVVEPKLVRD
jgi:hypothetical protein